MAKPNLEKVTLKIEAKTSQKNCIITQTKICIAFLFKCCSGDIFHLSRLLLKPTNHKTTITDVPWLQIKGRIPDVSINLVRILNYGLKRFYLRSSVQARGLLHHCLIYNRES